MEVGQGPIGGCSAIGKKKMYSPTVIHIITEIYITS
jgi:hypothetical protein